MKILLTTLHAKYSHSSLALPSLAACCRDLQNIDIAIREFTVNEPRELILRHIMSESADVVAFSCYIWNIEETLRLVSDIKKISGDITIILGGPEASFGVFELMHANPAVDFVVKGEGEATFLRLVSVLMGQGSIPIKPYTHHGPHPEANVTFDSIENLLFRDGEDIASGPLSKEPLPLDSIPSPFEAGLVDLDKPLTYYETSRGCPFSCAFCLSSVEGVVRSYSLERIRSDLLFLIQHNVPQIKLVDRTFNYDAGRAGRIWEFILEQNRGSHYHFEIAADLLTDDNIRILARVPEFTFRFEIGVQSTSEVTLEQVGRKSDLSRLFANVRRLRLETSIELHLDLVAGLPGEDYAGFLASLRDVAALDPHELQIEPLKVLKGSPMREIAAREGYRFSNFPPYMILSTPWLSFEDICRIETIGRLLDLFYNHAGYKTALQLLRSECDIAMLLDRMARQAGNENLSGRATRRVYELFARLAGPLLSEEAKRFLHDALFFDYCRSEMPLMGKLPDFVAERQRECAWPGRRELPEGLDLPGNSRVKIFRFSFLRDYRVEPWTDGLTAITFVYASSEGRGFRVSVLK